MSLKFAAKVHIYDRSGFTKPRLVPPCGATFLRQQTGPTITGWWRPGLAPGQRRLIMTVQQRPIGLSKWLGALCRLLTAFGRLWRLGIATIPGALLAIHTAPSTATATKRSRPS